MPDDLDPIDKAIRDEREYVRRIAELQIERGIALNRAAEIADTIDALKVAAVTARATIKDSARGLPNKVTT